MCKVLANHAIMINNYAQIVTRSMYNNMHNIERLFL